MDSLANGRRMNILTVVDDFTKESVLNADSNGRANTECYIESFKGKLRDECLNDHWFGNLPQAQQIIARLSNTNAARSQSTATRYRFTGVPGE